MFAKTGPADAPATRAGTFSMIGADVTIRGELHASVDLHLDGRIEGEVTCAALVQGGDSVIQGNITAKAARIAGTVEGSVTADELTVEPSARITGDCHYGTISVATGARVDGRLASRAATAPGLKVVSG